MLVLLADIAVFVTSNSTVGASVRLALRLGAGARTPALDDDGFATDVTVPTLFDFGLMNSVRDMWRAKVYPLSVAIFLFSGVWPYAKVMSCDAM